MFAHLLNRNHMRVQASQPRRFSRDSGHARAAFAPYKRIRRLEFAVLPKTISGKIRRVELRKMEAARREKGERGKTELWLDDK